MFLLHHLWMNLLSLLISPVIVSYDFVRSWSKSGLYTEHNKCSPQKTMAFVQRVVLSIKYSWKKHLWYRIPYGLFIFSKINGALVLNGSLWNWLLIHSTTQASQINIWRSAIHHCPKSSYRDLEDKPELTFAYRYVMDLPRTCCFTSEIIVAARIFILFYSFS